MTTITNAMLNHYNLLAARAEAETLQNCIDRADAAEAEAAKWRELHDDRDRDLKHEYARANAAEAEAALHWSEVEALDAQLAAAEADRSRYVRGVLALLAEVARLREQLAEAQAEIEAAQNETIHLRDAMDGACALRDAELAQAEVERLRAELATLRRPRAVIYDLCQFNKDVGKGALLPPSLERDVLEALATTDNSSQDAAGG